MTETGLQLTLSDISAEAVGRSQIGSRQPRRLRQRMSRLTEFSYGLCFRLNRYCSVCTQALLTSTSHGPLWKCCQVRAAWLPCRTDTSLSHWGHSLLLPLLTSAILLLALPMASYVQLLSLSSSFGFVPSAPVPALLGPCSPGLTLRYSHIYGCILPVSSWCTCSSHCAL